MQNKRWARFPGLWTRYQINEVVFVFSIKILKNVFFDKNGDFWGPFPVGLEKMCFLEEMGFPWD